LVDPIAAFRALLGSAECGSQLSGAGGLALLLAVVERQPAAARGRGWVCAPRPEDCAVAPGLGLKRSEVFRM
jgi:hypothetical protein